MKLLNMPLVMGMVFDSPIISLEIGGPTPDRGPL